jgi:hypothetical protein
MAKDTLLKEAIADAKAVKEAAIANAMLTLKEAFKPQLSSMLAAKLRNEEEVVEMEEQKKLDSSGIGTGITVDEPAPKKPSAVASDSSDIENKGIETDTMGEGFGNPQAAPAQAGGEDPELDIGMDDMNGMGGGEEGQDDGLDLEAIIRELEADLGIGQGGDVPDMSGAGQQEMEPEMKPEGFNSVDAGLDAHAGVSVDETLEGTGDEGVHKDGKDRPSVDGVPSGKKVTPGQKVTEGSEEEEEVDLDEIVREIAAEDKVNESSRVASQNAELKRSLREHREVIQLLRNRINEVTLLNSKLMFTTKIFRGFNLSEAQKKRVVEQFDRAATLREAKIIYTTLAESLTGRVSSSTPRTVKNITEGASKTVASTKPKSQTVINEGNTQVSRMQKLAGIINS